MGECKHEFLVYLRRWTWTEQLVAFAGTLEEAEGKAKAYIPLGDVRIEEQLTRTVKILKKPVCE